MSYKENEMILYGLVVRMQQLIKNETGDQALAWSRKLQEIENQLKFHKFRVAVVGEFKRGKSSFINVLLGKQVLPEDVLPTTATLNRITYGEQPKAFVYFRNSLQPSVTISVDELSNYVTKWTSASAEKAKEIQEVVVEYPTMFCFNDVDLIDTPGMNDEDSLNDYTVACLKNVDLAIVAINAQYPFSETENHFVVKLLESDQICQIIFVVTHFDLLRKREQQKMLDYLQKRISENLYSELQARHSPDEDIFKKYSRIFRTIQIYGVSSLQGMEALETNDMVLYKESGFQQLTKELPEIILKSRSVNLIDNMADNLRALLNDIYKERLKKRSGDQTKYSRIVKTVRENSDIVSNKIHGIASSYIQGRSEWNELLAEQDTIVNNLLMGLRNIRSMDAESVHKAMLPVIQEEFRRMNRYTEEIRAKILDTISKLIYQNALSLFINNLEDTLSDECKNYPRIHEKLQQVASRLQNLKIDSSGEKNRTDAAFFWHSSPIYAVMNTPANTSVLQQFHTIAHESLEYCMQKMLNDLCEEVEIGIAVIQETIRIQTEEFVETVVTTLKNEDTDGILDSDIQELIAECESVQKRVSSYNESM